MRSTETSSSSGKLRMKRLIHRYQIEKHSERSRNRGGTDLERSSSTSSRELFLNENTFGAVDVDATGCSCISSPDIKGEVTVIGSEKGMRVQVG